MVSGWGVPAVSFMMTDPITVSAELSAAGKRKGGPAAALSDRFDTAQCAPAMDAAPRPQT
ncbi:hypothetical protein GCM10007858_19300 [Bradyrhizobium liaoningense]|nr:hypothetical protein GCM10007858_19300 [Bradyrhizobium liaoningense]